MQITPVEASWLAENVGKIDFLSALTPDDLEHLVKNARPRLVRGTETVIEEGRPGLSFFLVYNGGLSVWVERGGKRSKLGSLKRGDFFGEISLLSGKPATANVIARRPSKLFFLNGEDFVAMLRNNAALAKKVMTIAQQRFAKRRKAIEKLLDGTLEDINSEIKRFLSPTT